MSASLEDVGKSPGGDSIVSFLRVAHNDNGTLIGGGGSGTSLGVFNVKDPTYGAVGDGVTDDTAAINSACSAAAAVSSPVNGGLVYLPRGNYKTTGQINVPPNCWFMGDGKQATYISPASDFGSGKYVVACSDRNQGRNFFRGFTIQGGGADPTIFGFGTPSWLVRGLAIGSSTFVEKVQSTRVYSGLAIKGNHSVARDCWFSSNYYGVEYEGGTQYGFDNHLFERLWLETNMKAGFGVAGGTAGSRMSAVSIKRIDIINSPFGFYKEAASDASNFMLAVYIDGLGVEGLGNFLFFDENKVVDSQFQVYVGQCDGGIAYSGAGSAEILAAYNRGVFSVGQSFDCEFDCNSLNGGPSNYTSGWIDTSWQMDGWRLHNARQLFLDLASSGKKLGTKPTGSFGYSDRMQFELRSGSGWTGVVSGSSSGITKGQLVQQQTNSTTCDVYSGGNPAGFALLGGSASDLVPIQVDGPTLVTVPVTGTVSTGDFLKPSTTTNGSLQKAVSLADGPIVAIALASGTNTSISVEARCRSLGQGSANNMVFSHAGTLSVVAGAGRFPVPKAVTVVGVRAAVGTVSAGASIICDVNKNGTTIFTTQANRPTIAAGSQSSSQAVPDVTSLAAGDLISVDIDQVGSTTAGSDLTVVLLVQQ